jgi:hypothetical protein
MAKRKITIEIEVETMNSWDTDYTPEFTSRLQLAITDTIQKETRKWNRFNRSMRISLLSNKNEVISQN